ncbi:helix-turn-helix domain-containing protein [Streptomyces sp. NBC_01803]|uniref:helix-turn-helix domain-containing protein n=1 Tax=Streptomyces sp. NBC_01803 TaxID=2975946 RepID=UPI002DDA04DB|nr:helix-turn-helix domain-containing protein [Streptomyces sp. NBC_01803]WSA42741.1 helix-turn-helix domain-containing protein [Streptomyces sp. NBC_01803]
MTYQRRSEPAGRPSISGAGEAIAGERPDASALVGAAVRAARLRAGLSTRELAALAGISQPFLSQVERGQSAPSVNTVYRLAEALGLSPAALMPTAPAPDIHVVRAARREVSPLNERPDTAYARTARHTGAIAEIIDYAVEPGQDIEGWF